MKRSSENKDQSVINKELLEYVCGVLNRCSDINHHKIQITDESHCSLVYINTIIDGKVLNEFILKVLVNYVQTNKDIDLLITQISNGSLFPLPSQIIDDPDKIITAILEGNVALFFENRKFVFLFPIKDYKKRGITESKTELVIEGPQDALVEDLDSNLSLLRSRLKHPNFKVKKQVVGEFTKTSVCILYIEGLCQPELLKQIETKLNQIQIQGILGVSYLAEFLEDMPHSPFPEVQYSERPDTIVASLFEGRIALLVEGVPVSIIAPVTLESLLQASEDYHQHYVLSTWIRWIRFLFVIIAFLMPSFYVAIITFHPEMIPPDLLVTLASAREAIPFPTLLETLIMEITFEGLREAGSRIPKPIGQTISILGAIVIGQTAVQAGIVSSSVVIIVSITGIASYIIPHYELSLVFRLLRFPILLLGGLLGLFGIVIGIILILGHLVNLNSFGVPYMKPFGPFDWQGMKDAIIRSSWRKMSKGNQFYTENKQR